MTGTFLSLACVCLVGAVLWAKIKQQEKKIAELSDLSHKH